MAPEALGAERSEAGSGADPDRAGGSPVTGEGPDDAVPDEVREAARKAFDARPRDVLVADLMFDSLLDGDRRAGADPSRRSLRFGQPTGGADLTVTEAGDQLHVLVQVLPAQKCDIEIRSKGPVVTVSTNDTGSAEFTLQPGLMSLIIRPTRAPRSRQLQTAWVRI